MSGTLIERELYALAVIECDARVLVFEIIMQIRCISACVCWYGLLIIF